MFHAEEQWNVTDHTNNIVSNIFGSINCAGCHWSDDAGYICYHCNKTFPAEMCKMFANILVGGWDSVGTIPVNIAWYKVFLQTSIKLFDCANNNIINPITCNKKIITILYFTTSDQATMQCTADYKGWTRIAWITQSEMFVKCW